MNSHELRVGDELIDRDGQRIQITAISQRYEEALPVSNLTIGDHHNYCVASGQILVHNVSICDDAVEAAKRKIAGGADPADVRAEFETKALAEGHTQAEIDEAWDKVTDPNWVRNGRIVRDLVQEYFGVDSAIEALLKQYDLPHNSYTVIDIEEIGPVHDISRAYQFILDHGLDPGDYTTIHYTIRMADGRVGIVSVMTHELNSYTSAFYPHVASNDPGNLFL